MKPQIERPNPFRSRKFLRSTRFPFKSQSRNSTKHSWRFLIPKRAIETVGFDPPPPPPIEKRTPRSNGTKQNQHGEITNRNRIDTLRSSSRPILPSRRERRPKERSNTNTIRRPNEEVREGERRSSNLYPGFVDILLRRSSLHKWYPQQ